MSAVPRVHGGGVAAPGNRWAQLLLASFVYMTLIGPAAGINKLPFALMFLWLLWDMWRRPGLITFPSLAPVVITGIFLYGLALSLVNRSDVGIAVQFVTSTLVLPLIYFIRAHDIDMDCLVERSAYVLLACTLAFWLSILGSGAFPLAGPVYDFFINYNFSAASDRDFFDGGATATLQLGTAPFLFVGLAVVGMRLFSPLRRRMDPVKLAAIVTAILVSGLRALIGVSLLYLAFLALRALRPVHRWLLMLVMAALVWLLWWAVLGDSQVLSAGEESNAVKIGHFNSFLHDLTAASAMFGRGLASFYFSSGSGAFKAYTELTPIDMCRYFGIPLTLVLYGCLLMPVRGLGRYLRDRGSYTVAVMLFVLMSMTNPVMFNSYGMLVILWYWSSLCPRPTAGPAS